MSKIDELKFLDFSKNLGSGVRGVFSLARSGDMKDDLTRQDFVKTVFRGGKIIFGEQIHHTNIALVDYQTNPPVEATDGIFTKDENVVLAVFTADCIPVFIYDAVNHFCGLIHAGWRGISKNIIVAAMDFMEKELSAQLTAVRVVIGPGICVREFEISAEISCVFPDIYVKRKKGKSFVDLKKLVKTQLVSAGVKASAIYDCGICSVEEKNIFSHRRDKTSLRNAAFIKLL
ncbi:MAG: laccase domain-containing protein [Elusimicrobia bacterium]|nr:laccase domain-containing protein [Elusimicrobiota bacterium]